MKNQFRQRNALTRRPKTLTTFIVSFISVMLVPMCTAILFASDLIGSIDVELNRTARRSIAQIVSELESTLNRANLLNYRMSADSDIKGYLSKNSRDYFEEYKIRNKLLNMSVGDPTIASLYMYLPEYDYVISNTNGAERQYYHTAKYMDEYSAFADMLADPMRRQSRFVKSSNQTPGNQGILAILRAVNSSKPCLLVTEIDLTSALINMNIISLNTDNPVFLYYERQPFASVYGPEGAEMLDTLVFDQKIPDQIRLDERDYTLYSRTIPQYGLELVYAVNRDVVSVSTSVARRYASFALCFCLVVSLSLVVYLSKRNYRPVKRIIDALTMGGQELPDEVDEYQAIESMIEQYASRNLALARSVDLTEHRLRDMYLENLLKGRIPDARSVPDSLSLYNIHFKGPVYQVAAYTFFDAEGTVLDDALHRNLPVIKMISDIFERQWPSVAFYSLSIDERLVYVFNGAIDLLGEPLLSTLGRVATAAREVASIECEVYVSEPVNTPGELPGAYAKVADAITRRMKAMDISDSAENQDPSDIVGKCTEMICREYSNSGICVSFLAEQLGISSSYLSRYFKQQTGVGLLDYIHRYRVLACKELMVQSPELPLNEVAQQTGFFNVAGLIRVFKKIEGMTPGQYREQILSGPESPE